MIEYGIYYKFNLIDSLASFDSNIEINEDKGFIEYKKNFIKDAILSGALFQKFKDLKVLSNGILEFINKLDEELKKDKKNNIEFDRKKYNKLHIDFFDKYFVIKKIES